MSAEDDVRREFNRQSSSEKRAIASSWESFLTFCYNVIVVTADVLGALKRIYDVIRSYS